MAMPELELAGRTLSGYDILEIVGEGGMGVVYRARQVSLDREVALKILASRLSNDDEFVRRFQREARSIAKINDLNILQVYDVADAEGFHFIAMEFIRGDNLSSRLKAKGFIEWRACTEIIKQASLGLAAAARAGIIHRDVKPDNLMITEPEGIVKVSDFGLAKEASSELTQTGDLMGTPAYMSPEQCDGNNVDTRTDIYSLGATFYRAVTGILPFNAPTPVAMMYKQKHEELVPPRQYMPNLPEKLGEIITRMMAKVPAARYATMDEVVAALNVVLQTPESSTIDNTILISELAPQQVTSPSSEVAFDELVALGNRFMKDRRPVVAVDCWRRALELRPDNTSLKDKIKAANKESTAECLKIGDGLLEQGQINHVRAELQKVLEIDPDNVDAREKLTALDFVERRKRETMLELRKMLAAGQHEHALVIWESLHPSMRDKTMLQTMNHLKNHVIPCKALVKQAEELTRAGDFDQALAEWDKALELDPSNDGVKGGRHETWRFRERMEQAMREGYEFNVQRKYEAAITCFDKVLELSPGHTQAKRLIRDALIELARDAENHHDIETAISRWKKVLEYEPGDKKVMAEFERLTRKRNSIEAHIEAARKALSSGNYGKSIRGWQAALAAQPTNKTAEAGLIEAKRQRLRRRFIPLLVLILIGAGVIGLSLHMQYEAFISSGDSTFEMARRLQPDQAGEYPKAIANWEAAKKIPLLGQIRLATINRKIRAARVWQVIDEEAAYYDRKDLEGLRGHHERMEQIFTENGEDTQPSILQQARFDILWHQAHLLTGEKQFKNASSMYTAALKLGKLNSRQDGLRVALNSYLVAKAILATPEGDREEHEQKAREKLQIAVNAWGDFEEARTLLSSLTKLHTEVSDYLKNSDHWLQTGRGQVNAGKHELAAASFTKAESAAREVLKLQPSNWYCRKVITEIRWRGKAGPSMVFFVFPVEDDKTSKNTFRAFALDIYEWPNMKGSKPETMTFTEALAAAEAKGKTIPTRDEWQFAARGGVVDRQWEYSYGKTYDPGKGNTQSRAGQTWPSGSSNQACTPEGLYDLTGNVAEWVIDQRRAKGNKMQLTAGGHYASKDQCRNGDFEARPADLSNPQVGFRAVMRWVPIKRQ